MNAAMPRRTPTWWWLLLIVLALSLLMTMAINSLINEVATVPAQIVVDGVEMGAIDPADFSAAQKLALSFALALVVLLTLVLVLFVAAIVLSPLWLMVLLVVWLWRKSASPGAARAAKIAR